MSPLEILTMLATPILLGGIIYAIWEIGHHLYAACMWLHTIKDELGEINKTLRALRNSD